MRWSAKLTSFALASIFILSSCTKIEPEKQRPSVNAELEKEIEQEFSIPVPFRLNQPGPRTPGFDYVALTDINPELIREVKLQRRLPVSGTKVKILPANNFLAVYMTQRPVIPGIEQMPASPMITKFDNKGTVLWEKVFPYKIYSGMVSGICALPDSSFIFSVQSYPYNINSEVKYEKSFIIKCDNEGREQWKLDFDDPSGRMIKDLILTDNGDIIAVGEGRVEGNKGSDDIVLTKIDNKGRIIKQKSFGGSDFDQYFRVKYDNKLGLIICGLSQSKDGDLAASKDGFGVSFIASFNDNLELRWKYIAEKDEIFSYEPFSVHEGNVYLISSIQRKGESANGMIVIKLDSSGKKLWTRDIKPPNPWPQAINVLENGDTVLSFGQPNEGSILVLDKDGNERKRLTGLGFTAETIFETEDGGFITTAYRNIKAIPAPAFVSSIWYDKEVVAVKFNKDFSICWRKTYDKYKNSTAVEQIEPLEDGRLAIVYFDESMVNK